MGALLSAEESASEIWHEIRIAAQPAGYLSERTEPAGAGGFTTIAESRIVINRLGSKVELQASVRSDENTGGHLLAVRAEISSSAQSTVMEGSVGESSLQLRISTGGKTYERTIPFTGALLGPEGARHLTLARLKQPDDSFSYQTFVAEMGVVATVTRTCVAREAHGIRIKEEVSGLPGQSTLWLDADARLVRRVQPGPFGDIESQRATKGRALAAAAGATLPAEMYTSSVVRSNIRLPHERLIETMRVRVTHRKPELGWPDFAGANQTVLEKTPDSVVLEIRRPKLDRPAESQDPGLKPFLAPNALFQSDDREVRNIARQVADGRAATFAVALALRDWTSEHVRFDAGIAIAPASEVVRNRAGTCFGYAILLGSLARAAGIPSRMQMGFAYVGGIWGGHAWIEVWVNGRWIPIDAALPSPDVSDAARISFFSSSLEEGALAGIGSLAQMYGNVNIEALGYTLRGESIVVPEHAPPFVVDGNSYTNQWLRLKLVKPDGYRFTRLDATWPESTVVAMEGPRHESVELAQLPFSRASDYLAKRGFTGAHKDRRVAGRSGFEIRSGNKAALVLVDADETWVIVTEAPNAGAVLETVAAKMEWR
jgi:hypothetical protein